MVNTFVIDAVIKEIEELNDQIKDTMVVKKLDASNNARKSLKVVVRGDYVVSEGIDYFEYLNRGRGPGKFPPISAIRRWIDIKGLSLDEYAVATNLAKYGSRIYNNRSLGIQLESKIFDLRDRINKSLPDIISNSIISEINNAFI